jgi:hypothetical protein
MDIAPKIKDATEAIRQFPPLFEAILDVLKTPTGWIVLLGLVTWLLVNRDVSHLFSFFERKTQRRLEYLDSYVAKPDIADKDTVDALRDLRDAHYFRLATQIYAEKRLRSSLINLHDRTSHHINWTLIRRALPYIEMKSEGEVSIRPMTTVETIGYWYNQVFGFLSLVASASIFTLFLFEGKKSLSEFIWGVGGALGVSLFAFFVFAQNLPVRAAKTIEQELDKPSPNPGA